MNPYDVLGVPQDATQEQIKAAYRKAASAAHPDREGGSAGRMQEVNMAYACLCDVQRRLIYDQTNSLEDPEKLIHDAAVEILSQFFSRALLEVDREIVEWVRQQLQANQKALLTRQVSERGTRSRIFKKKGRVTIKQQGQNIYERVLSARVADLDKKLIEVERNLQIVAKALEMLAKYESSDPKEQEDAVSKITFPFPTGVFRFG